MERLQSELRGEIDGKRYLLVLDDWWNLEREKWLSLKTLLLGGARGSKILITTRLLSVAKITGTTPPHLLEGLYENKALAKNGCELGELKGLNNIRGSLCIENLESVTDAIADSRAANLIGKHSLESLKLEWGDSDTDDSVIGNRDEKKSTTTIGRRHQSNQVDLDSSDSEELHLSNHDESSGGNNLILELHSLRSVDLSYLPKLASLPRWLLQASNLEVLSIHICEELDICKDESGDLIILDSHGGLHHSLRSVTLFDLPKLASLPRWLLQASNLERLRIIRCYNLKELPEQIEALQSLQRLHIDDCPSLTSLPEGMGRLASLTQLHISGCGELESFEDESGNNNILDSREDFTVSGSVDLYSLPKIASLPQWLLQASNLERLEIKNCSNLKELPEQIEALQSLRQLRIFYCPSLTSLPEGMRRLASLTHLEIFDCPELERRCKRDGGEDWDKIAHIPHITHGPFSTF
ncbi:hypothetical protein NL676_029726 [Syzygium grande]|nr:hypothetical protein NL676_029726 [Syzygium grande]